MKMNKHDFAASFDSLKASLSEDDFGGYPKDYQRIDQKTLPVIDALEIFRDSRVLEIGSNFGMYSLLMSEYAEKVFALEIDDNIFEVGLKWRKFFEERGLSFDNLEQIRGAAREAVRIDYNALLLTLVLYHLKDDEIDLLVKDAKQKCEKIIVQCRPGRAAALQRGSFKGHVSKNQRFDGLYDIAGNIKFLEAIGMKTISITVSEKMLGSEVFPVLVGSR